MTLLGWVNDVLRSVVGCDFKLTHAIEEAKHDECMRTCIVFTRLLLFFFCVLVLGVAFCLDFNVFALY